MAKTSSPNHIKHESTANTTKPENDLPSRVPTSGEEEKTLQKRVKWHSCDPAGPKSSPHPSPRAEGRGRSREGVEAQDYWTPGPGDLLQEHEPTLHSPWWLVGPDHRERCEEQACSTGPSEKKQSGQFERLPSSKRGKDHTVHSAWRKVGWTVLPQPALTPKCWEPSGGLDAPPPSLAAQPRGSRLQHTSCWPAVEPSVTPGEAEGGPQLFQPHFGPTREQALGALSSWQAFVRLASSPCHSSRLDRGWLCPQQSSDATWSLLPAQVAHLTRMWRQMLQPRKHRETLWDFLALFWPQNYCGSQSWELNPNGRHLFHSPAAPAIAAGQVWAALPTATSLVQLWVFFLHGRSAEGPHSPHETRSLQARQKSALPTACGSWGSYPGNGACGH